MDEGTIRVRLAPVQGGAYTRLRVTGVVPTAVPRRELWRLARKLAHWSGYPVQCALSAVDGDLGWCGWWLDQLAAIPGRHLVLRCARGRVSGAGRDE